MRHLWSLLAGLVAAPLAWLLLSTGQFRSVTTVAGWDQAGRFDTADLVAPAAFLAGAGVLLGLLGTLRWSPVGPLVAGLLYIVPTVLMFIDPFDTLDRFLREDGAPRRLLGQDLEPWLPVENGTLLVLGALLLMAVLSGQRWRPWPAAAAPAPAAVADKPAEDEEEEEKKEKEATHTAHAPAATMTDDEILAAAAAFDEQEGPGQKATGQKATGQDAAEPSTEPDRTATAEETADRDR